MFERQHLRAPRSGMSILELVVVLAVIGVLAGLAFVALPRQGMAVNQGQRIFGAAIQFARFEAIRRNDVVEVSFPHGASQVVIHRPGDATAVFRTFDLDPQARSVVVKDPTASTMTFNSRGVALIPASRTVTIGILGNDAHDVGLEVSGQGSVRVLTGDGS